ncbi:DEAD/DEAH box helicase [Neobacillus sp. D3-1R]|uniref:DEAD/DEAH box helicase n=1 Tax=Neobacillus sp. D3-1R TaxID=3445778 RepID=UPI003FA128E4
MISKVGFLITEMQKALQAEIQYLKKYGSSKFILINGRLIRAEDNTITYFFESTMSIRVPVGAKVKIVWGKQQVSGRILSSEGNNVIVEVEANFGERLSEVFLFHDPWELLEQLTERLDEIKKSKKKRMRVKRVLQPNEESKHPLDNIKSNVHELILRSQFNPVTFVWGPPGTGKTYTLARVASNKYIHGKRILILAHSNQAIDVLMAEISSFIQKKGRFKEGDIFRYGTNVGGNLLSHQTITTIDLLQTFEPGLAREKERLTIERKQIKQDLTRSFSKRDTESLLDIEVKLGNILEKIRQKEIQFVKEAKIIGATLAKAASDPAIYEKEFDLVIIDEASMAYVPQIAFSASLAKRIIICGDFKQLPPIAAGKHALINEWLREDIFQKSGVNQSVNQLKLHPHLVLLREQRRMHPDISAFTNKHIYHSLVSDHASVEKSRNELAQLAPFPNFSSILVDVSFNGNHCMTEKTSNSRFNLWQLFISFQAIYESYLSGINSIGYVTPYRSQSILMETLLEDLLRKERSETDIISATVHRFQGSERDVMIFDTVDSYPLDRPGVLLVGQDSERLINVAITRTKGKFIHVSDSSFIKEKISKLKTLRKLVEHQLENRQAIFQKDIGSWIKNQHPRLNWIHAKRLETVTDDILHSQNSILLSIHNDNLLSSEWITILNKRNVGVTLTLLSPHTNQHLKSDSSFTSDIPFPFVLIDERILWLGLPLEGANRVRPPYVAARLDSEAIGQFLKSQLSATLE